MSLGSGLARKDYFSAKVMFLQRHQNTFFLFYLDCVCQLKHCNVFSLLRGSLNANCLFV